MINYRVWLILFIISLTIFLVYFTLTQFKTDKQIFTNTEQINETSEQQKLNEQLLESVNNTLHQFQVEERGHNKELNDKIVENQQIIIDLANHSLVNQHFIIDHFDNITKNLTLLIDLSQNNSANNLVLTKLNRANIMNNLNMTKFNRMSLLDSNIMIHKLYDLVNNNKLDILLGNNTK